MIEKKWINDLSLKWDRMQEAMRKTDADGCLLSVDVNLFYTTGKIFSGYFYLPATGVPCLFVKRPAIEKQHEANGADSDVRMPQIFQIRKPEDMPALFGKLGLAMPEKLYLEADELTYNDYIRLQAVFSPKETANATALMRNLRQIKTPVEIDLFRISARQHAKTYGEIKGCFHPGMTDLELQFKIEAIMRKNGSMGLFRAFGANMDIFMGSILAGDNAETPSPFDFALGGGGLDASCPLGANGTVLKPGTAVMVDMAGNYTAYMTDMTRVFAVGELPDIAYKAHATSLLIQREIETIARPGTPCADLYTIALKLAQDAGLEKYFMGTRQQAKFVGHGIGIQINELPVLTPRSKELLTPGMVFALEPKFVIPGVGAVGIENSFLVTDSKLEKLTLFEEEIIRLDC